MVRILVGFLLGIVVALIGALCYVRFGFVDPRADAEIGALETKIAMPALDASVDRRAPDAKNPVQPTNDNLIAGMNIYQQDCAGCHGDIHHPHQPFGASFYPRAPQFLEDAPDMPENQNFYIIQHGVRLSGMPAWALLLDDQKIWKVTTFLSHMNKLSPAVVSAWKMAASAQDGGATSNSGSNAEPDKENTTNRPTH